MCEDSIYRTVVDNKHDMFSLAEKIRIQFLAQQTELRKVHNFVLLKKFIRKELLVFNLFLK